MTKQAAKNFLEKIEKDAAFRAQLQNAKTPEEKKKILEKSQLLFTKKEYMEAFQEKNKRPLTAEELSTIAGAGTRTAKTSDKKSFVAPIFQDE